MLLRKKARRLQKDRTERITANVDLDQFMGEDDDSDEDDDDDDVAPLMGPTAGSAVVEAESVSMTRDLSALTSAQLEKEIGLVLCCNVWLDLCLKKKWRGTPSFPVCLTSIGCTCNGTKRC